VKLVPAVRVDTVKVPRVVLHVGVPGIPELSVVLVTRMTELALTAALWITSVAPAETAHAILPVVALPQAAGVDVPDAPPRRHSP
jgi:hypothetical protein